MDWSEHARLARSARWVIPAAVGLSMPAAAQTTERVSVDSAGGQSGNHSWQAWISGSGQVVAFESLAPNLVPDDTNGRQDIFVRLRGRGETLRVSVSSGGMQANGESARPAASHSGRYIAFQSAADNLVPGDTNGAHDIFVHDLRTGETVRASTDSGGGQANGRSIHPAISADGRFVVFHSEASNLVAGDTNGQWDVFVHDLGTGATTRDSVRTDGGQGNDWSEHPTISGDGSRIAYHSAATNLVEGDTNGTEDVFLFDRALRVTRRISTGVGGAQTNGLSVFPSFSTDGGFVAYESEATNLVAGDTNGVRDIFIYDIAADATVRASVAWDGAQPNGDCFTPSIARGGRLVVFCSNATNLVPDDTNGQTDAFVRDLAAGKTFRVSLGATGQQAAAACIYTTISAGGGAVAFQSAAANLVEPDTNFAFDIFVRDLGASRGRWLPREP